MIYLELALYFYFAGFFTGFGLFLLKYHDLTVYPEDFTEDELNHDLHWFMIFRNFLVYCCLSWLGVYMFFGYDEEEEMDDARYENDENY